MSKKLILSLALSGLVLTATAQTTVAPAIPRDETIELQIETLLKKMTLDEKVGQMCELTIDVLQKRVNPFASLDPKNITVKDLQKIIKRYKLEKEFKLGKEMPSQDVMMKLYMRIQGIENAKGFQLDEAMLDSVIGKYKVGSILNVPNGVAQSVEKWQEIIKRIQEKSMEVMGIPCVYGVDQIHGTTYTLGGTFFPQGVNMGATFNRELTREGARISAYETKAGSIPWTYAPVTDLGRDPRWPRMWENYGEDCYVNAEMGREAVIGFQGGNPNLIGENNVAACMKHYMGYGVPVSGKDRTPSSITGQDMREKHFAPYLEMVFVILITNIRYMLMSCALSQKFHTGTSYTHRFFVGFGITDEIFGISIGRTGALNPYYTYGAMAAASPAGVWGPFSVWWWATCCPCGW